MGAKDFLYNQRQTFRSDRKILSKFPPFVTRFTSFTASSCEWRRSNYQTPEFTLNLVAVGVNMYCPDALLHENNQLELLQI